jgi:hypothetical protein
MISILGSERHTHTAENSNQSSQTMISIENLDDAAPLVEEALGKNCWKDRDLGWVECPGSSQHTAKSSPNDCKVFVNFNGPPRLHCFHASCHQELREANGKLCTAWLNATVRARRAGTKLTPDQLEARALREMWTKRTTAAKSQILRENAWSVAEIIQTSPIPLNTDPTTHWKDLLGIFGDTDVIWVGDLYDSGDPECRSQFKTKTDWVASGAVPGAFTCPAVFNPGVFSRSLANVKYSPYLVVESDTLDKDQTASLFRWLRQSAGLHLVAVVDTAGKSVHGWFQMPDPELLERLKLVLPVMGCDRAMFSPAQPCRLPGAIRDGQYQKLLYLDTPAANGECDLAELIPLPPVYYDGVSKNWLMPHKYNGWFNANQGDVTRYLSFHGYSSKASPSTGMSAIEHALYCIQQGQSVDYASSLAGYDAGHYVISGKRILVTSSPTLIPPKQGDFPLIKSILEKMFDDQLPYFYGWLHGSLQMFYQSKTWRAGQVVAFAGPPKSGKSLLQDLLTKMFGGRSGQAFKYMTDRTNFNGDLFGAEHLVVEDAAESVDIRARRHAGSFIKQVAVNKSHSCERKHADALTLTPRQRMTISLNDDPERLQVLPPIEGDIQDKIMLFKVKCFPMPMPTSTGEEIEAFGKALRKELPAFIDFILNWSIPSELQDTRSGVKAYHHPDLLAALRHSAPEETLLELIDEEFFSGPKPQTLPWNGRARNLYRELVGSKDVTRAKEAQVLLRSSTLCGKYLGRLASDNVDRVERHTRDNYEDWTIYPPEGKEAYRERNIHNPARSPKMALRLRERLGLQ